jgi:hypothetical protein
MQRQCEECGRKYTARRSTSKYCTTKCRSQHYNYEQRRNQPPGDPALEDHPLLVAVRKELEAAGRLDSTEGMLVIGLARQMVDPSISNAALVAASKELSRVMAEMRGRKPTVVRSPSPPDELTVRRSERVKRGYGGPR